MGAPAQLFSLALGALIIDFLPILGIVAQWR